MHDEEQTAPSDVMIHHAGGRSLVEIGHFFVGDSTGCGHIVFELHGQKSVLTFSLEIHQNA